MLEQFVEKIRALAVQAAGPQVVYPKGEPDYVYLVQNEDKELVRHEAAPLPRRHTAGDLQTVAKFANSNDGAVVWFNRNKVVAVLDDDTRRDTVTLPLTLSKQILLLISLETKECFFKQPAFILWLRTNFKNCLEHCSALIDCLRSVKFDNGQVTESQVQHGKSSLGTKIRSEVTALDRIPEYVIFRVPVFDSGFPDLVFNVELVLEPVAESGGFRLIPLPGQIENAICLAEQDVGHKMQDQLEPACVPVYFGSP